MTLSPPQTAIIYTAIAGGRDNLKAQPVMGAPCIAFLDHPSGWLARWLHRPMPCRLSNPCRTARYPKVLAHKVFPGVEYSMWIDGSITLGPGSFAALIEKYLSGVDLAALRHPERDCLYAEGEVVMKRGLDPRLLVDEQLARYRAAGHPEHTGLVETGILLRRHTPEVRDFELAWWDEIEHGSRRDQISFPYVARKLGLKYGTIADRCFFQIGSHT